MNARLTVFFATLVLLGTSLFSPCGAVDLEKRMSFDIPAQKLSSALIEFSQQAKVQVVTGDDVSSLKTKGLKGSHTIRAALAQLLADTGLKADSVSEKSVVLKRETPTSNVSPAEQMRVAIAESGRSNEMAPETSNEVKDSQQVVVQGERDKRKPFSSANIDLTRTEDDSLPFTTFTAKEIQLSGAPNLESFFRARLPSNFSSYIPEERNGGIGTQSELANSMNLRGLGGISSGSETVILVNGRRLPKQWMSSNGENSTHVPGNFRGIPMGSIERIEILSSAGSAIYGESATAGIINIITRRDYKGGQITLQHEAPWDGHAPYFTSDFSYASPLFSRSTFRVSGGYSERSPLLTRDRADVTNARWRALTSERDPSVLMNIAPFVGGTTNIRGPSTGLFGPGSARDTSVPDGYLGDQGITPFLSRQGVVNYSLADGGNAQDGSADFPFGVNNNRFVLNLGVETAVTENWRASMEYQYTENSDKGAGSYANTGYIVVPGAAAINPFMQDVAVAFDDPRMDRPETERTAKTKSYQLGATLRGSIHDWQVIADLFFTDYKYSSQLRNFLEPVGGWSNAFITGAYNPFVDMRIVAPAAPSFYETYILNETLGVSASRSYQATTKVSGPIMDLPGGPLNLTAGLEWVRDDRYRGGRLVQNVHNVTREIQGTPGASFGPNLTWTFDTYSVYSEATGPVLGPDQEVPLIRKLELFASGRFSEQKRRGFTSSGISVKYDNSPYVYAFGMRYDVIEDVAFRMSRSIGYNPPILSQVTPANPPTTNATVIDRRRNQSRVLGPSMRITGGNPELEPESTTSKNIGVILKPHWFNNLRISVDYLESVRNDAITPITPQNVVDMESDLSSRVIRGEPDGHASGVGPIMFVDARNINLKNVSIKSMDYAIDYQVSGVFCGALMLGVAATRNLSLKIQSTATSLAEEQVGNRSASWERSMAWNGNAQATWEGDEWSFGWSTKYFDKVLTNFILLQGGDRAKAEYEHDAFASVRLKNAQPIRLVGSMLEGTTVTFGVRNIFNRKPRYYWANADIGIAPFDSVAGRVMWLQLRKEL